MKRMIKVISVLLAVLMLCGTAALAVEDYTEEQIAQYYDPANYEHTFVPGVVLVTLKSSVTQTSNYEQLFPELSLKSAASSEEFSVLYRLGVIHNQHIVLTLTVRTRQSVLDAIELLKVNPNVLIACPNYSGYIADEPEPEVEDYTEEQIAQYYDPANYERTFVPGVVLVTLKSRVTQTSNYEQLFPELSLKSVASSEEFRVLYEMGRIHNQHIVLTLTVRTRQSVLDAIYLLKENPNVLIACPNYSGDIVDEPEPEPVTPGDVSGDGDLTNGDLILVARHLVNLVEFDAVQLKAADFDEDGNVSNTDLVLMARTLVIGK